MRRLFTSLSIAAIVAIACAPQPSLEATRSFMMGATYWPPQDADLAADEELTRARIGAAIESSQILQFQLPWSPAAN
jgi:hypothetical protein